QVLPFGDRKLGAGQTYGVFATYPLASGDVAELQGLEDWARARKADAPVMDVLFLEPSRDLASEELDKIRDHAAELLPEVQLGLVTQDPEAARQTLVVWAAARLQVTPKITSEQLKELARLAQKNRKLLELQFDSVSALVDHLPLLNLSAPVALSLDSKMPISEYRRLAARLDKSGVRHPIHLSVDARGFDDVTLEAASALGSLLMDGIGDSIEIRKVGPEEAT